MFQFVYELVKKRYPFPTYKISDVNFEIIVTKGEIAHNEQFLHLPQCFQLYSIIILSIKGIFNSCVGMFSNPSAADLLYVGEG